MDSSRPSRRRRAAAAPVFSHDEVARTTRTLVEDVVAELARLREGPKVPDAEVVHALRVAIRKLRAWLEVGARVAGGRVGTRELWLLRRLARRAGAVRDVQLMREWLAARRAGGARLQHAERLDAALRSDEKRAARRLHRALGKGSIELLARLRARAEAHAQGGDGRGASARIAAALEERREVLLGALAAWRDSDTEGDAHAARIAAKKLRYLLQPLLPAARPAVTLSAALERVQEALGLYHDAQVRLDRFAALGAGRELRLRARRALGHARRRAERVRDGAALTRALASAQRLERRLAVRPPVASGPVQR